MNVVISAFCFGLELYGIADGEILVAIAGFVGAWLFGTQVART